MKIACILKRLRRVFPDADWINIDTERGVRKDGSIDMTHNFSIRLACGTYFLHEAAQMNEVFKVAECLITLAEINRNISEEEVLTSDQVFKAFALSSPASIVKVEG